MILALAAVAALALAGCGGSSSEPEASAPSTSSPAVEGKESNDTVNQSGGSVQEKGSGKETRPSAGATNRQAGSESQGKHGARAQLPEGEPEPTATPSEEAQATVADIALESPDLPGGSPPSLPVSYTCDGGNSWPSLRWQGVPAGTGELIVFAMNVQPVEGKLFFDWAVAGLDPSLEGIDAGELPKGAVQGANSLGRTGYSLCPPPGQAETYVFALYAIPKSLSPPKGFDPHRLREEILAQAGNAGLLVVAYGRS